MEYLWTDGRHEDFHRFYLTTEHYYSKLVAGEENRKSFIPFNISDTMSDVILAYIDGIAIACAGMKKYSEIDAEVKRVWVEPGYRGNHIASDLMKEIERKAKELGYHQISNYPPYDKMDVAICFAKEL